MAKQYKIRWKQSDIEELRRVVSNFNKKLKRLQSKEEYAKVTLPEKASIKELKSLINTISAESIAISDPILPMAIPTSAFNFEAPSLICIVFDVITLNVPITLSPKHR